MKPDWCDEATWEKAQRLFNAIDPEGAMPRNPMPEIARALIAARNEGMGAAAEILRAMHNEAWGIPEEQSALERAGAAIRSRIHKEG